MSVLGFRRHEGAGPGRCSGGGAGARSWLRPQALARGQEVLSSDFVGSAQQLRLPTHGGSGGSAAGWQRAGEYDSGGCPGGPGRPWPRRRWLLLTGPVSPLHVPGRSLPLSAASRPRSPCRPLAEPASSSVRRGESGSW